MKGPHFCPVDEKLASVHVVVGFRSGTEVRPHRNHQVKIVLVKVFHHPRRVGITRLVKHRLAHGVPPKPILHDVVNGDVQFAVFVRHAKQLFLRAVSVFALPKAVRPLAEKRRRAGQFAISRYDAVELGSVKKVVVHLIGYFRAEIERAKKAVVEAAPRGMVPENAIAVARQKERNANVGVVLRNIHRFPAIIPYPCLVLAKPIKRFVRTPQFREEFYAVGRLAIHDNGRHGDFRLLEERLAAGVLKRNATIFARDNRFDLRRIQNDLLIGSVHLPFCCRPVVLDHYEVRVCRNTFRG